MLELYGRQWEAGFGHVGGEAFLSWRDGLSKLSFEQIKSGLDYLVAEGGDYPPNLIKFLRLCRMKQHPSHQTFSPQLPGPKPKYSVFRIETAKQKALTGKSFKSTTDVTRYQMDWTDDDETALCELIEKWDESTGHDGLNRLIDNHRFGT